MAISSLGESGMRNVSGTLGSKMFTSKDIVYEKRAPYSNSIKAIIIMGFAVLVFSSFFAFFGHFAGFEKVPEQAQLALLLAASLYALVMWGFFSMKFRITDSGVEAVMPPFKYGIPFSDIKSVRTIENTPWYAGWGMHLWGRRLFFVSMRKSVVAIEKRNGFFRTIILTTRNPEVFTQRIKEKIR